MVRVEICQDPVAWDGYVEAHPDACNYHRWRWRQVICETFGHEAHYLSASTNNAIQGVLPLVFMSSRMFGDFLVSVPFFSYGGVVADTSEAREALLAKAAELACELRARHVELRQGCECDIGWRRVAPKVTMKVDLPASVDELAGRLSPKMRKRIRYARKSGLDPRWSGIEGVDHFYPVFATNMRNLGTPVYPRSWFENICRRLPEGVRILTLWKDDRPVAGAFLISFRSTLEMPWAASLPESRESFSPLLLYWTVLEWALENGFREVDLGRCTPGSGNHDFKRRWVCAEEPLNWYYWLAPFTSVPELRPENARYRLAIQAWKHLPLAVANRLGPRLVRSIP